MKTKAKAYNIRVVKDIVYLIIKKLQKKNMLRYKYILASILLMFLVMSYANYKDNKRNELYDECAKINNNIQNLIKNCMNNK